MVPMIRIRVFGGLFNPGLRSPPARATRSVGVPLFGKLLHKLCTIVLLIHLMGMGCLLGNKLEASY